MRTSSAMLISSALSHTIITVAFPCMYLLITLLQFYFHLITSISLARHIKISFSPTNQQFPQLSDCNELSFILLSFFSSS